jgi:hypothetical protein
MPEGAITDPHVIDAILAVAGAVAILFVLICLNMAQSDRERRERGP